MLLVCCRNDHKQAGSVLRQGDLVFQDLDCGPLCDAIEEVTYGRYGLRFSHIGLVIRQGDSLYAVEAIGEGVRLTPLAQFLSRTDNKQFVGRLKPMYHHLVAPASEFAGKQAGTAYDRPFIYNNGKYYCSELIYDAFLHANGQEPFFRLEPMTFKRPGSNEFFPAWIDYYTQLGMNIPQDSPGINPAGISRSEKIDFFELTNLN